MSATITNIGTVSRNAGRAARAHAAEAGTPISSSSFTGTLYHYHGLRVLDVSGRQVGTVDWVWSDVSQSHGEFIGVQLQWLRGRARAIPTRGATVDMETGTVRVPYRKHVIRRATRYAIDRELTAADRRAVLAQYTVPPVAVPPTMAPDAAVA
jgi:hypothetical protein